MFGGAIFGIAFGIYTFTLCPTVYWEDSAAFCAVHSLLGIPHSPGFPVYVVLGRLFTLLPVPGSALGSNLMSAFWGGLALALLYLLATEIFSRAKSRQSLFWFTSATSVFLFAFSTSFWLQNIRAEVYTLNILFTLLLMFLLTKWSNLKESASGLKILLLFSFILGLSLTNHPLLIITLLPAFLVFVCSSDSKLVCSPEKFFLLIVFLLLGVSLYLYVPIRSSLLPPINWGKPDTWSNFVSYLFRTSQASTSPAGSAFPYLNRLWFNLSFPVNQFGLHLFWLGVVGAISLFKSCRGIFLFTCLVFILNILTATWAADFSLRNYDLLGYLLPSLSVFTVWLASGLQAVLNWMIKQVRVIQASPVRDTYKALSYALLYALFGSFLLLPIVQLSKNFGQCNKKKQTWAYNYAHKILSSVKKDALVLVNDDNTLTSLWYVNLSCGVRPDVKVLSLSALEHKVYREQIKQQYPNVQIPKPAPGSLGEIAYQVSKLNALNLSVYSACVFRYPPLVRHLRPAGYLFEFCPKAVILTDKDTEGQRDFLKRELNGRNPDIIAREHFGNFLFNLGVFYDQVRGSPLSVEYFLWALDLDPSNARIYFQLGKAFLRNGEKAKALDFFQAGLELDPYNQEARKLLEKT